MECQGACRHAAAVYKSKHAADQPVANALRRVCAESTARKALDGCCCCSAAVPLSAVPSPSIMFFTVCDSFAISSSTSNIWLSLLVSFTCRPTRTVQHLLLHARSEAATKAHCTLFDMVPVFDQSATADPALWPLYNAQTAGPECPCTRRCYFKYVKNTSSRERAEWSASQQPFLSCESQQNSDLGCCCCREQERGT